MSSFFSKFIDFFESSKNNYGFTSQNVKKIFPRENWSEEKRFAYYLTKFKLDEPTEDYINKETTRYQDFIINEQIGYWDIKKICSLNGIGLHLGEGWYTLVKNLMIELDKLGWDRRITGVKQKWAELRFSVGMKSAFYERNKNEIEKLLEKYREAGEMTCEQCGKMGKARSGGWITVLCREHYHNGISGLLCNDLTFKIGKNIYVWEDVRNVEINKSWKDRIESLAFTFKNNKVAHLYTRLYGFGKFINDIPSNYLFLFNAKFIELYNTENYCEVCGLKSFYNDICEACEFTVYRSRKDYEEEDIKIKQIEWFKDGAETFYKNNQTYPLNPDYKKLFSQAEYDRFFEDDEEGKSKENAYRECNKNPINRTHNKA